MKKPETYLIKSGIVKKNLNEANTLLHLGDLAMLKEEYPDAKDYSEKALSLFQQLEDFSSEARTMQSLGGLAMKKGEYPKTKQYFEKALILYKKLKDPFGKATTLLFLGVLAMKEKDKPEEKEKAKGHLEEALKLFKEMGIPSEVKRVKDLLKDL